jgi:hypothetical protein
MVLGQLGIDSPVCYKSIPFDDVITKVISFTLFLSAPEWSEKVDAQLFLPPMRLMAHSVGIRSLSHLTQ